VYLHVGTGEDESREKDLADQLGVSKKIVFCGGGVNPRIALCASDAFIMPSLYEGFGCAALEAMYSAVPTILAKVPGLEEVGTLCGGVIWTDAEDASTTEAINRIRKMSTQERITLGDKLSESARRHFSMKLGAGEYLSVYTASDDEWKQSVERMS
jgi:glycosyltransferase involved in cell wall biosynthesis